VFKVTLDVDGILENLKAGLVAKGFEQAEGVDYNEDFSQMVEWKKIRSMVAIASKKGWKIKHLDMKTTILSGDLDVMDVPACVAWRWLVTGFHPWLGPRISYGLYNNMCPCIIYESTLISKTMCFSLFTSF
jgi:hypothetical protein